MPARVSILRTNNTIFPQHALVVSDTFDLSQAHEAHERAVSWETSPRAWVSNVFAIEIKNGLRDLSGAPIYNFTEDDMSELLTLRKEMEPYLSSVNNDSKAPIATVIAPAAQIRTSRCLIQPSVTATLHSQNPTIYAILKKQRPQDQVVGGVLDSGAQRGTTGRKSEILKHTGTSLLMQPAVGPAKLDWYLHGC